MKTQNHGSIFKKRNKFGFTLVELIVIITILVILGTIAFISLQEYLISARDGVRVENMANLKKGLDTFQIQSGIYPLPENSVTITVSGSNIIGYQGFAKEQTENIAKLSFGGTKDPLDSSMYLTYLVNTSKTKMELAGYMEDGNTQIAYEDFIQSSHTLTVFASSTTDYSKRLPVVKGDSLGILLSIATGSLNQPIQETGTGVDVVNTSTGYSALFSRGKTITGTGSMLTYGYITYNDNALVGYWNFDDLITTTVYDSSGNGNYGILKGDTTQAGTLGKIGNGITLSGTNYIEIANSNSLKIGKNTITMSAWIKSSSINYDNYRTVLSKGYNSKEGGYALRLTRDSEPIKAISHVSNGISLIRAGNYNNVANDIWYNITGVVSDSKNCIYVNGILDNCIVFTGNIFTNNLPLRIGRLSTNQIIDEYFIGSIDEVRIYSRALSDSEILSLYNATK